ncbi:MAG: AEC family transporter [Rhodocyclaceae bacterium]|nr:AEC family transporter [Rhodocyclaceae bacterium]
MNNFLHQLTLAAPHFGVIAGGYALVRWAGCPKKYADLLTRFVFLIALPATLFRLMSDLSHLPAVDTRLLLAYFGSCLFVFGLGRFIGWRWFNLDGKAQSIFGLGGVFSNNVLLGIPLATSAFGVVAMPTVALILVFNALTLWTLVTVSVEWAVHGEFSLAGFGKTIKEVASNPIVASIVSGSLFGFAGGSIPPLIDLPLSWLALTAAPLALLALGMGLAGYGLRADWRQSLSICCLKLLVQPIVVWLFARSLNLPPLETQVVVLLAALPVGVNVYLMARQFRSMETPVASSLVASAILASFTIPMILALLGSPEN